MQFGIPKVITTDQGSEFNNNLDRNMMKMLNINHRLTTPYHPQVIKYGQLAMYVFEYNYYWQ